MTDRLARVRGYTLLEMAAFISIVSIAVAGCLLAYQSAALHGADPVVRKQALAIAQSLLEEIQQMPFTFCDPDDPAAPVAASTGDCTSAEGIGPEAGESRYSSTAPFDNVNDYHGYNTPTEVPSGIKDVTGTALTGLSAYNASVSVSASALGAVAAADSLLIAVTVTAPQNVTVKLEGYRLRYAPRL